VVEKMEDFEIENFINLMHQVHCDNSKQQYYAVAIRGARKSIMPLTPFVYEYFLFNSLYQVDWQKSYCKGDLVYHSEDIKQFAQQKKFLKFIQNHAKKKPADFYRAFEPLIFLQKTVGEWTKITPDARITAEGGIEFFKRISNLQILLKACQPPENIFITNKIFDPIREALQFIYLVRNNIFHGAKTLGEVYEPNQKRRIGVYDLFLKGVMSLFFLSVGKTTVASDFVPCPISSQSLPILCEKEILSQDIIWKALNRQLMKLGDSRLISQFTKNIIPPKEKPNEKTALFYPSSGRDLLTPIILGLPYCSQFYFFERSQQRTTPPLADILKRIPTVKVRNQRNSQGWDIQDDSHYLEFEYDGVLRKIYWVHSDNKNFLKKSVELTFYFHRGDGSGEGGSGQKWDSKLAPNLLKKIPTGKCCIYLTDGVYGGIDPNIFDSNSVLSMPFIERDRKYYYGKLYSK